MEVLKVLGAVNLLNGLTTSKLESSLCVQPNRHMVCVKRNAAFCLHSVNLSCLGHPLSALRIQCAVSVQVRRQLISVYLQVRRQSLSQVGQEFLVAPGATDIATGSLTVLQHLHCSTEQL